MQRLVLKQALFLAFLAGALFLLLGFVIVYNARSEPAPAHSVGLAWERFDIIVDYEDEEETVNRRLNRTRNRTDGEVRYNRVEGLYLGMKVRKDTYRSRMRTRPLLFGGWGYAFKAKEFQYQIGLEKGFFDSYRLAFGAEHHRRIDTPDRWIVPDEENSLAAFFLCEDFHDFYKSEGWTAWISQDFARIGEVSIVYQLDQADSVAKNTNWSLFGGKKRFRANPAMDAGEFRSIGFRAVLDTRNSTKRTTHGWYIQAEGERAGRGLGGQFEYDRILVDARRYQPLGFGEGIDIRLRFGTSHGLLPWQKSFHLGGLSSLRGFEYKAFPYGWVSRGGNRMVLAQVEYRMGSENLPDGIDFGLLEHFNLILFNDAGWVENAGPDAWFADGFDGLSLHTLKHDVGIALANRSGSVRFEIARRTDTGHKPYTLSFRINRPF
jgi:outer membrane protein assembly factor BamA